MKINPKRHVPASVASVARLLDALRARDDGSGFVPMTVDELAAATGKSKSTVDRAISIAKKGHGLDSRRAGNGKNHASVFDLTGVKWPEAPTHVKTPIYKNSTENMPLEETSPNAVYGGVLTRVRTADRLCTEAENRERAKAIIDKSRDSTLAALRLLDEEMERDRKVGKILVGLLNSVKYASSTTDELGKLCRAQSIAKHLMERWNVKIDAFTNGLLLDAIVKAA